jgi:small subunit ribosomal protein S2
MKPYIYGKRHKVHIINLQETIRGLYQAVHFLRKMAAGGAQIMFLGTKRQLRAVIESEAQRCGMPAVTERWIGGTLTNFSVIRSRLRRLEELEKMEEDGSGAKLSKKYLSSLRRERRKIHRNLSGIREMKGIPGAMLVIDPAREYNAVREARKLGVPVIGILDTDCDPNDVDIVIPGNDDALKSVRLLVSRLINAVEEGAANHREQMATMGNAQHENVETQVGDEPRPTRNRPLPRPLSADGAVSTSDEVAPAPAPAKAAPAAAEDDDAAGANAATAGVSPATKGTDSESAQG